MRKLKKGESIALFIAVPLIFFFFFIVNSGPSGLFADTNDSSSFDVNESIEGLIIDDVVVGRNGEEAIVGSTVTVHYVGEFEDGTVFDSSRDRGAPFEFVLGSGFVIPGWDIGIQGMRVGGQRTLTIPPELAYGSSGVGPIPPNATLTFSIELLSVSPPPPESQ